MSKHTPGPWTVGTWMDHRLQTHPDGLTRGQLQIFPIPSDDEAETIAHLIAAAPDTLKNLIQCEALINHIFQAYGGAATTADSTGWDSMAASDAARKAIANAKGEATE